MDYVVHINDGSREVSPIVLRLLPGEETRFNLKVINHGEPSNVSLEASDPIVKAVRLKRPDSYVEKEESIPIMARMPQRAKRVEGELLLTSSAGSSSVPISLVRESDDYGDDSYSANNEKHANENPSDDIEDRVADGDEDEDEDEAEGAVDDGADEDKDVEDEAAVADGFSEDAEKIKFSREKDLQSYRAASRPRSTADLGDSQKQQEELNYNRKEANYSQRESNYGDETGYENGSGNGSGSGSEQRYEQSYEQGLDPITHTSTEEEGPKADADEVSRETFGDRLLSFNWERGSMQIVPAIILLAIIIALVLTFYTETIPLYAGALASAILIVTLIIYGAATLLKA